MSYADFQVSAAGRAIAPLLDSAIVIARMEELSRLGQPAVAAIDAPLAGKVDLSNTERQHVGRWVRDVLGTRGWRVSRQRRLAAGKVFTSGSVYVRRATHGDQFSDVLSDLLPIRERVARARALAHASRTNDYGVDDYLADKYAESAREPLA